MAEYMANKAQKQDAKPAAWDVNAAWADLQAARAAGDVDAEMLAMRRWSEAQTNASIALVGQVLRPLTEQIANARRVDLDWRTDWRTQSDAQSDALYKELDRIHDGQGEIKAVVEAAAADTQKLSVQLGEMGEALHATIGRVDTLEETQHDHGAAIEQLKAERIEDRQTMNTIATNVREMTTELQIVKKEVAKVKQIILALAEESGATRAAARMLADPEIAPLPREDLSE